MTSRRWDSDERGRGVADARGSLAAIQQLAELAGAKDWVTEDPETHLMPGLRERAEVSGLVIDSYEVEPDGALRVRLTCTTRQSRREIRQSVWSILGGVAELTTFVREVGSADSITFEIVTGIPPGEGPFATHGHVLRLQVEQA
ncbi:MAG TPA: hypothetical protein VGS16_04685 [Candidatus Dormibacteraeota bacterium]|nr:hypothetical protein [Candidatus Dormibacteraeota bacterium]